MKFKLGETLEDSVTHFKGVVMARTEYHTGCITYGLSQTKCNDKGGISDWEWVDETRLKKVKGKKKIKIGPVTEAPGGPFPTAPEM